MPDNVSYRLSFERLITNNQRLSLAQEPLQQRATTMRQSPMWSNADGHGHHQCRQSSGTVSPIDSDKVQGTAVYGADDKKIGSV